MLTQFEIQKLPTSKHNTKSKSVRWGSRVVRVTPPPPPCPRGAIAAVGAAWTASGRASGAGRGAERGRGELATIAEGRRRQKKRGAEAPLYVVTKSVSSLLPCSNPPHDPRKRCTGSLRHGQPASACSSLRTLGRAGYAGCACWLLSGCSVRLGLQTGCRLCRSRFRSLRCTLVFPPLRLCRSSEQRRIVSGSVEERSVSLHLSRSFAD